MGLLIDVNLGAGDWQMLYLRVLLPVLAIHIQGDDGTALVFLGIGLVMVFAGGISGWLVAGGLAAAGCGAALLLKLRPGLLKGYQAKRIFAVLDPENPALADIAYQQNKGAIAIGTGGFGASMCLCQTPGMILSSATWPTLWALWGR